MTRGTEAKGRHSLRIRRRRGSIVMVLAIEVAATAAAQQTPARVGPGSRAALLEENALQAILCGSGSPLPDAERAGPCTAVLAAGRFFVVDAGLASWENLQRWGIPAGELDGVLLTHFHSDHIGGLGEVIFSSWAGGRSEPLDVYGPAGVREVVDGFLHAYALDAKYRTAHHGAEAMPPRGAEAEAREIVFATDSTPVVVYDVEGLRITAFLVDHAPVEPAVGYRFDYGGRSLVVSGDTKRSGNLVAQSRGVDVLIHEVLADAPVRMVVERLRGNGQERTAKLLADTLDYHTFPRDVFAIAGEANVSLLVLTHLVPPLPQAQAESVFRQGLPADASYETIVGRDGFYVVLPAGSKERRTAVLE
jgi:ribonuclease Z